MGRAWKHGHRARTQLELLTWFSHRRVCTETPVTPRSLGSDQVIPGGGRWRGEEWRRRGRNNICSLIPSATPFCFATQVEERWKPQSQAYCVVGFCIDKIQESGRDAKTGNAWDHSSCLARRGGLAQQQIHSPLGPIVPNVVTMMPQFRHWSSFLLQTRM